MKLHELHLFPKDGLVPLEKGLCELWGTAGSMGGAVL